MKQKLSGRDYTYVASMLFGMFFGAGNLIFPVHMGQMAGSNIWPAIIGFCVTGVGLPLLGVAALGISRSGGLFELGSRVGKPYSMFFTCLLYLTIGPFFAIPRCATTSFTVGLEQVLPQGGNTRLCLLAFSAAFFAAALFFSLRPGKILVWVGKVLNPCFLLFLGILVIVAMLRPGAAVGAVVPEGAYASQPFFTGFLEGYNTMDTIAALNFGLVISATLGTFGLTEKKDKMRYTILAGVLAGTILAVVYAMLSYMGMCSSGVYPVQENGAWTLRCIVYQVFGGTGAVLLAAIFTLACLTTCVGLINSISQYFSTLFRKISYRAWVYIITFFSFLVCNLGLSMILSISIPILNAIYPVSIVLILLGLSHDLWKGNRFAYPMTVAGTAAVSIAFALGDAGLPLGVLGQLLHRLPLYRLGFGWVCVAAGMLLLSFGVNALLRRAHAAEECVSK